MVLLGSVWVIGVLAAIAPLYRAQIFPFSNLKHFFDQRSRTLSSLDGPPHSPQGASGSGSELKPLTVRPPPAGAAGGGGLEQGGPALPALLPTPTPSTTRFPLFRGPLSYFDEDDGFRELRLPDSKLPKVKPRSKPKSSAPRAETRTPLHTPHSKTYEKSTAAPPLRVALAAFLTPPPARMPNLVPVPDAAPAASQDRAPLVTNITPLDATSDPAGPASSLPPVPDFFLRPPSVGAEMAFYKHEDDGLPNPVTVQSSEDGRLELSDVAKAAVSVSKNPAIAKKAAAKLALPPSGPHAEGPANHKLASQYAGNALEGPRHKDEYGAAMKPVRAGKPDSGPSNHRPDFPAASSGKHESVNDSLSAGSSSSPTNGRTPIVVSSDEAMGPAAHRSRLPPPPPPPPPQHKYPQPQAALHPNHRPQPPRPGKHHHSKYLNHRDNLDAEESMSRPKYRKKHPHHNHQPYRPLEQEVAESGLHQSGGVPHSSDGDRVEFQMHGLEGPKSYKFGYDTGKGHNRQFRYEERDHHGNVKGHYGYVDEHGKLQIVNYKADPHHGYSADVSKLQL